MDSILLTKIKLIAFCSLLFISGVSVAQNTGAIEGVLIDKAFDVPLTGAQVRLLPLNKTTITGNGGSFNFKGLETGNYSLVFSFMGYKTDTLPTQVNAGNVTKVQFELEDDFLTLEGISLTIEKSTHTETAVVEEIKNADQVVSGISSEQIAKSQDRDAAQVVKRIPGVTIIQDKYIVVRGLNERYNAVMLHDIYAPSMEADVRSFSFDIIPSNMIDRIMIYKSPSPELPGDFAGGMVKVYTKSIPDRNELSINYSTSARQYTTFNKFYGQERGLLHNTGFNDGLHNMPDNFPTTAGFNSQNVDNINKATRSLPNNWQHQEYIAGLDHRLGITLNRKFSYKDKKMGLTASLNYNNKKSILSIERNSYLFGADVPDLRTEFTDAQYSKDILFGGVLNYAVQLNDNHSLEFKNMYNQMTNQQFVDRYGNNYGGVGLQNNYAFMNVYRGVYSSQLLGKHTYNDDKTIFNWVAGYSWAYRDMPDYRRYRTTPYIDDVTGEEKHTIFVPSAQSPNFFGKFYSNMTENNVSGSLNLEQHLYNLSEDRNIKLHAGTYIERKVRSFSARNLGYVKSLDFNDELLAGSVTDLFQDENLDRINGIYVRETTNPQDSYEAQNELLAVYAKLIIPFTNKLKLTGGARLEHNTQKLQSVYDNQPVDINNPILSILPSANLSYNFTKKMLVRAAYGVTVNRPEFRELAPFSFYDFNFDATKIGNPAILPATIQNFDLRWELYPSSGENITVAAFYKKFDNPIEMTFEGGGGEATVFGYRNGAAATNYGIELDVRKSLAGLANSSVLDDLSILFNASIIQSRVDLGSARAGERGIRPLQGQSPYIVNTGIYYNNVKSGIQANITYNIMGRRIVFVGDFLRPHTWEMPRHVLDLNIRKSLNDNLELSFGIRDIFNQEIRLLQDGNNDGVLDRENDQTFVRYKPGKIVSLGFNYTF